MQRNCHDQEDAALPLRLDALRLRFGETKMQMRQHFVNAGDEKAAKQKTCLLYTSDAADERSSVDLGGRRIIKKKKVTAYK